MGARFSRQTAVPTYNTPRAAAEDESEQVQKSGSYARFLLQLCGADRASAFVIDNNNRTVLVVLEVLRPHYWGYSLVLVCILGARTDARIHYMAEGDIQRQANKQ